MKLMKDSGRDDSYGLVGKGVEVRGDISFTEGLRVEGRVLGSIVSENGMLIIDESARLEAQVDVGVCVISGVVEGNVTAKHRVEIHKSSRVRGDVTTPVLLVEEGAVINGSVGMNQDTRTRLQDPVKPETPQENSMVKGA